MNIIHKKNLKEYSKITENKNNLALYISTIVIHVINFKDPEIGNHTNNIENV